MQPFLIGEQPSPHWLMLRKSRMILPDDTSGRYLHSTWSRLVNRVRFWPFRAVILAVAMLSARVACAQEIRFELNQASERKELETDRDAFTPAMNTVGYRTLVVESAYSFIEGGPEGDSHSFPELLTRYGVSDWIEFRLGWNLEIGGDSSVSSAGAGAEGGGAEEDSHIFYGFKAQVSEQDGWMPRSVFIAQWFTPTSGEGSTTHFVGTYGVGWELCDRIRWDSALRYATAGESDDHFREWAPSTVLRVPVGERWNAHIEYFAIATEGAADERTQAFISPGVHCLVTENLELGTRVGWGTTADSPDFFVNVGFGARY